MKTLGIFYSCFKKEITGIFQKAELQAASFIGKRLSYAAIVFQNCFFLPQKQYNRQIIFLLVGSKCKIFYF